MDSIKKLFLLLIIGIAPFTVHAQENDKHIVEPDNSLLLEYYQTQHYEDAAKYLQQFYNEDSQDVKILSQLGYANLMAGMLPEAENIYLKLYAQQPLNLPVLFNLATIQEKRGNEQKAKSFYMEIIALDSNNFNAYKQVANLSKENTIAERVKYFKKANELNPKEATVIVDLCKIYFKMNLYNQASEILEPALKADSANRQLLKTKIPISIAAKKYNEAIQTGQKLLSYGDSSIFVMSSLAKNYFSVLDYRNALTYFLKVKDKSVANETLFYNIALTYRGLKDYKNANLYLNNAIKEGISAKTASYYGLLGDSFENINKNEDAISAYRRGLLFENNGSLYYNIALVYENKLNDKKNAIANYNLYLKNFKEIDKSPKLAIFIKNKIEDLKR
ncbi:tetratricopeptide (TPR) repeat protein [Pedobacter sp. CG_S7]|uniref:tetratricopeptide repeat protein n=1 Tax=Pedobacter sp. CG_S7 TaxID=3143930 RepID=UPI00339295BF